jgi:hypothetical protein
MSIQYSFGIDQFLNDKVDLTKLDSEVRDSSITVSLDYINADDLVCDFYFRDELMSKDLTTLSGVVSIHDGEDDGVDDVQYVSIKEAEINIPVDIMDEYRDRSGKLRVHQTSRKLGTMIMWLGEGDDPSDPTNIGGGESFSFAYITGQSDPLIKYIDFNMVENETWMHEGYITWKDAQLDRLDLQLVPRVTATTSGTSYNIYGGYLIVPAVPGTGTIDLASDITQHDGGLVYMPPNDLGVRAPSFWNAEWDTTNKVFTNISPAPAGDGEYNLFSTEIILAQFVRKMHLLSSGFIALNSSDTDQLGHGMRLKMVADTNTETAEDHDWCVAVLLCLHRERSVVGSAL